MNTSESDKNWSVVEFTSGVSFISYNYVRIEYMYTYTTDKTIMLEVGIGSMWDVTSNIRLLIDKIIYFVVS